MRVTASRRLMSNRSAHGGSTRQDHGAGSGAMADEGSEARDKTLKDMDAGICSNECRLGRLTRLHASNA